MKDYQITCYYDFCGKVFNNKYNFKRHINTVHLQIKSYECEICGKFLGSKIARNEHLNSHLNLKPIECPFEGCNQSFARSSLLCIHKKMHKQKFVTKKSKKYEKRQSLEKLPVLSPERKKNQNSIKIPLHHLLII